MPGQPTLAAVGRWRKWVVAGLLFGVVVAAGGGWLWWRAAEEEARAAEQDRRRRVREREREERNVEIVSRLEEESAALMPELLRGVALGMPLEEVRTVRRHLRPRTDAADDANMRWMEERLENGAQIVYGFDPRSIRLLQIQIMSLLPSPEAVGPHLTSMIEHYGAPTGVWNCPNTGGVPTRRFTWRRSLTTLADVFLVYGERVSVTLYIAPSETIGVSLRMAACTPVSREELTEFPVTTVEAIEATQPLKKRR